MADIIHITSTDGTRIGFERSGSGPPLVLVHGTSVDRSRWGPSLAALERGSPCTPSIAAGAG